MTESGRYFFVGANRIHWWAAGISLYVTTFSAWMFTGAACFVYNTSCFGVLFLSLKPIDFGAGFPLAAIPLGIAVPFPIASYRLRRTARPTDRR